jgi:hypothetical protein
VCAFCALACALHEEVTAGPGLMITLAVFAAWCVLEWRCRERRAKSSLARNGHAARTQGSPAARAKTRASS